ncbi:MAG TPA: cell division protein SepF [Verrucomicrobiae bacterium]|nr:cell division protein SepF [Verrucomicrobiae bacterium]
MKFNLFHKSKQQSEPETQAAPPQEESGEETTVVSEETKQEAVAPLQPASSQETVASAQESKREVTETTNKTYLKAMPLKELADIDNVKNEVKNGNIVILRVTPLASKSIDDVKTAVNQLYEFAESVGGDIARLGEERVVICPKNIRIWREKTPANESASNEALPTAA